jgi:hypothetical protein
MTGNPKPGMGPANQVLDKIPDKRGAQESFFALLI